jgi:alginate O-acetyltransferase complex protein AlgI
MLFSSPLFVFLVLPIVLGVYFALRPSLRNTWLLIVSLFFYAWGEKLLVAVMLLTIVSNWAFGFWIERDKQRGSRVAITFAVAFDIGLLVVFKYADWLWNTFSLLLVGLGWRETPLAPLGSALPEGSPGA